MTPATCLRCRKLSLALLLCISAFQGPAVAQDAQTTALFAKTFDTHWERLRDEYPYFALYAVDWEAERAEHRPRALAAENPTEFAWELARLISALPDPHVSFMPSLETVVGHWSMPEVTTARIERKTYVLAWPEGGEPVAPAAFAADAHAYPEVISVRGEPLQHCSDILVGGPLGTAFELGLRWPDGSESEHRIQRPEHSNLPPPKPHFGTDWLVTGRVGSIGYLGIRTFSPDKATLGPDGKMTTQLRAALAELADTEGLILDFQGNGGGQVAASDPFLGHLIDRRLKYRWGNSGGKSRVIRPRNPRYRGKLVALVDGGSASGGEWAPRILRDAGRAIVVGERTSGAEAAVHTSEGPDGSLVRYSAWPMLEPGVQSIQERGIELDHVLPLTIAAAREQGFEAAQEAVRRARLLKALELLGAPESAVDEFLKLAARGST